VAVAFSEMLKDRDPVVYENKLKELSFFMGEVFKDSDARQELFDLAKADEYEEDITYSLKKLLDTNQNPHTRQSFAIVNAFYKSAENHRISGEEAFAVQDLIDFINDNEISMLAPYMIGYFEPESISELTVSWWTEKMEMENSEKDPDGEGETPAIKLRMNDENNFIQFRTSGANYFSNELVYANDDYAIDNPTVVFGSFDDDMSSAPGDGWYGGGASNPSPTPNNPSPICSELTENGNNIITVRMPDIQLDGNIRRWPKPNIIFMWVATGSFEFGSNGLPKLTESVNHPIADLEVKRGEARNNEWVSSRSSFIISNWKYDSNDAYIVWACTRTRAEIDVTGAVSASSGTSGNTGSISVKVAIKKTVELVSAVSYDKCFTLLNNRNKTRQGNLPLRYDNPVYEFGKVRSYFEIEKTQ
jgi:hypothetical protein